MITRKLLNAVITRPSDRSSILIFDYMGAKILPGGKKNDKEDSLTRLIATVQDQVPGIELSPRHEGPYASVEDEKRGRGAIERRLTVDAYALLCTKEGELDTRKKLTFQTWVDWRVFIEHASPVSKEILRQAHEQGYLV